MIYNHNQRTVIAVDVDGSMQISYVTDNHDLLFGHMVIRVVKDARIMKYLRGCI